MKRPGCGSPARAAAGRAGERSAPHRRHRRRSRRHRPEIATKAAADPALAEPATRCCMDRMSRTRSRAFAPDGSRPRPAAPRTSRRRGAVDDAERKIDAIATAPINKEAFAPAGLPWRGHTDLLAHLTGARAGRDDVLRRVAARRAGHGAHSARRRPAALTRKPRRIHHHATAARDAALRLSARRGWRWPD